jgi:hypothetical protein
MHLDVTDENIAVLATLEDTPTVLYNDIFFVCGVDELVRKSVVTLIGHKVSLLDSHLTIIIDLLVHSFVLLVA